MPIISHVVSVTTTGSDGSATGSATSELIMGELLDIHLNFHATAPNTTDTTISTSLGNLLVVTSSSTDALIAPRQKCVDNANSAITNSFDRFYINGVVTIALAECNALTGAVVATIRVLRVS